MSTFAPGAKGAPRQRRRPARENDPLAHRDRPWNQNTYARINGATLPATSARQDASSFENTLAR